MASHASPRKDVPTATASARLRRAGRWIAGVLNGNAAIRAGKNLRNAIVDHGFRRRGRAEGQRVTAELSSRGVRHAAFTIAFNSPWVIDLLTLAWARHQPDLPLIVVDNSLDRSARAAHAALCRERGVPYLPLPRNPEWNPCRSHGIALNWTWSNVIRHADLEFVGFIDHDCIPVAPFDLRGRMQHLDAYGLHVASATLPGAWTIWPGYCFLRPAAAAGKTVDFKHRIEEGLDTGGGNWRGFYRTLPSDRVAHAAGRRVLPDLGEGAPLKECGLIDEAFLHLEGASYRDVFRDRALRDFLADAITGRSLVLHPATPVTRHS